MTDPPVLLLGGTVNALWAARSMARAGVTVYAAADGISPSLVRHSRSVTGFLQVGGVATAQDEWLDWLPRGPRGAVVLPCSDPGAELIAHHRDLLLELGYAPVEANDDVVLAMLDKSATYELAEKLGVEAPRTFAVQSLEDLANADRLDFPVALKPVHSHRSVHRLGRKAMVIGDSGELTVQTERLLSMGIGMVLTEVVPGPDSAYCSYYTYIDEHDRPLVHFTKRKPRQYPPGFGWGCFHETTWEPDVAEAGLRFLQGAGLRGLGFVEFKRDGRDGRLKLIECNPRLSAANELVRLAGIDLAMLAYERALGRTPALMGPYRTGLREWHPVADTRACLALRRAGELHLSEWAISLTPPLHLEIFDRHDVRPSLVNLVNRTRGRLAARARRRSAGVDQGAR